MYEVSDHVPLHVGCATHASLVFNLNSIVRHGLKLGTKDGERLVLHLLPDTPDSPEFAQKNRQRFRDLAFTINLDKAKEMGFDIATTASGAIVIGAGLSGLSAIPMTAVSAILPAIWRIFLNYEPYVVCKDTYLYAEINKLLVDQREALMTAKKRLKRYTIPCLDDYDNPTYGDTRERLDRPLKADGEGWIAIPPRHRTPWDPAQAQEASRREWTYRPSQERDGSNLDEPVADRIGRVIVWENAGYYLLQRAEKRQRAHDQLPHPKGRNGACDVCCGLHFRQWCPQDRRNQSNLDRFFEAPTAQTSPWPGTN